MESVAGELLKVSIFGPILVAAGWFIWKQHKDVRSLATALREVQEKRVTDAQAVTDKLIQISDKWNGTIRDQSHLVEVLHATLQRIEDALDRGIEKGRR